MSSWPRCARPAAAASLRCIARCSKTTAKSAWCSGRNRTAAELTACLPATRKRDRSEVTDDHDLRRGAADRGEVRLWSIPLSCQMDHPDFSVFPCLGSTLRGVEHWIWGAHSWGSCFPLARPGVDH